MTPTPNATPFDPNADPDAPVLDALFGPSGQPVSAILVLATPKARADGWAGRAACALASGGARRLDRVALADLSLEAPELHALLGQPNYEGLVDVFLYGASLDRVARSVPDRGFHLVPAGLFAGETADLLRHPHWDRLLAGFRQADALLLVYAPSELPGVDALAARVGRAAVLAAEPDEAAAAAAGLPPQCEVVAALVPPGEAAAPVWPPVPGPAEPEPEPEADLEPEWRPRTETKAPRRRRRLAPILWLVALAAVALGAWLVTRRPPVEEPAAVPPPPEPAAAEAVPPDPPPAPARPAGVALEYSVAIESHQNLELAGRRLAELESAAPDLEFYLAPISVDGVVYYRVLAGPLADREAAVALMDRLVETGLKRSASPWDIRPSGWAYELGEFESRAEAEERRRELWDAEIPGYVVEVPYTAGPPRFRVYAGAYAGAAEGEIMGELLRDAGWEAPLAERIGRPLP